jgi:hypothetical protein
MRTDFVRIAVICGVVMLGGCRFKGIESFETATTPVKFGKAVGDKYAGGGIAYASAGTHPATRYGQGSDPNSPNKVDPKLDKPAYGSGQQPGDMSSEGGAGYGKSNAPANQGTPTTASGNSH